MAVMMIDYCTGEREREREGRKTLELQQDDWET